MQILNEKIYKYKKWKKDNIKNEKIYKYKKWKKDNIKNHRFRYREFKEKYRFYF